MGDSGWNQDQGGAKAKEQGIGPFKKYSRGKITNSRGRGVSNDLNTKEGSDRRAAHSANRIPNRRGGRRKRAQSSDFHVEPSAPALWDFDPDYDHSIPQPHYTASMNRPGEREHYRNEHYRNYPDFPHPSYQGIRMQSPPPSYHESVKNCSQVYVYDIVKVLSKFDKLTETTENISHLLQSDPEAVLRAADSQKDLFSINRQGKFPVISLDPRLALCIDHLSKEGCSLLGSCRDLHICRDFINESCKSKDCVFGHNWHTNHNHDILSRFHLNKLDSNILLKVLKKSCKNVSTLEICEFFNNQGRKCKYGDRCNKLHMCKKFIWSTCTDECSFNHDFQHAQCRKVIQRYNIQLNESPRDIIMQVRACLEFSGSKLTQKPSLTKATDAIDSDIESESGSSQISTHSRVNSKRTLKSTDLCGDVEIPQICVYSMDRNCKDFQKGCKYLHAMSKFHWQVEDNGKWFNFPVYQSKELETAYCNVSLAAVQIPPFDIKKIKHNANEYKKILGTGTLKADFQEMNLSCNSRKLNIRRLSTPSASVLKNSKATLYEWYFQDEKGCWIRYGQVDSLGKHEMVSPISSTDIEDRFTQNPSSSISFKNDHFEYDIDLVKMVQVNKSTNKKRAIRRRPSVALANPKSVTKDNTKGSLPSHWTQMSEDHKLVDLNQTSAEYKKVFRKASQTLQNYTIKSIQRLQNPYLWQAFQSKKASLSCQYSCSEILTENLFHGIDPQDIDSICMENIDWRREDSQEQRYGLGTYFYNSVSEANSYLTSDDDCYYLILAQVIIGETVKGKSDYKRPPTNQSTNKHYDTAVDNVSSPSVYVKFEKDEYYPEYVIKIF